MDLGEYQERVRRLDAETGWDRLTTPQLLCHFAEEAGEVVKAVNHSLATVETTAEQRAAIAGELSDTLWFLAKLANRFGVSLDERAASLLERAPSWAADGDEALRNGLARLAGELRSANDAASPRRGS